VRPVWLQGSRVTTAVSSPARDRHASGSCASASISACGVPDPRCHPSATMRPSGSSSTQPTCGFGSSVGPRREMSSARRIASSMYACSSIPFRRSSVLQPGCYNGSPRARKPTVPLIQTRPRLSSRPSLSAPESHRFGLAGARFAGYTAGSDSHRPRNMLSILLLRISRRSHVPLCYVGPSRIKSPAEGGISRELPRFRPRFPCLWRLSSPAGDRDPGAPAPPIGRPE
jgi:hypothetical protein